MGLRGYLILFFGFILFPIVVFSQSSTPGGSVRLAVLGGGSVDFVFNSMNDYTAGITLTNWTLIGISVRDEAGDINPPAGDDYTTWTFSISADDPGADGLDGLNPANKLPLSNIQVRTTVAAGCATCNFFGSPWVDLSAVPAVFVDGSGGGADQIEDVPSAENLTFGADQMNISYRCGVSTSLLTLSLPVDYYSDDIWFDLIMSP
jgi:hypothetical protein